MGSYRADIKEQSAENLSLREAVSLQIDGVMLNFPSCVCPFMVLEQIVRNLQK